MVFFSLSVFSQSSVSEIVKLNDLADSLEYFNANDSKNAATKALELALKENNDTLIYESQFRLGIANFNLANFNEALSLFIKNSEIAKKLNRKKLIVQSINAIANTYKNLGNYEKALASYNEALTYCDPNKPSQLSVLIKSNLIGVYRALKNYDKSIQYCYDIISVIQEHKSKDTVFISNIYGDLLFAYMALNKTDSINKYLDLVIDLKKKSGDVIGLASFYHNIGSFYADNNNEQLAEKYFKKSIEIKHDNYEIISFAKNQLADLLLGQKRFEEAAFLYKECIALQDTIAKIQTIEKLSEMEVKYETGKKEEELKRLSAEQEINNLKVKQSKTLTIISVLSVVVFLGIAVVLYKQNKNKQSANKLLKIQNDEISHQKKEITDSINYAKRIQLAILPPDKMVQKLLPNAFVFYKPKDVVSGDFYWVEEKNGLVLFAAVDCTGHGVPGAMMSVIGLNLLNRAVKEKELTQPSEILTQLDIGVTDTLRQDQDHEAIKDGMDLSLCTLNPKTLELQYAGAFNNLWIVRKNIASTYKPKSDKEFFFENDLLEIKADKFPIGSNTDGVADIYSNHTIQLQKGDCVYLYSDGFADQFGGPKGKKFKYNSLKKLLVSVCHLNPSQQKEKLQEAYINWKGNVEQIDDILVIGVCV